MAIRLKFSLTSTITTDDHSQLVNRDLPDQHPMDAITGLLDALAKKYEKPEGGIPREDLAFDIPDMDDITEQINNIWDMIAIINQTNNNQDLDIEYLQELINMLYQLIQNDPEYPNLIDLNLENRIHEEFVSEEGDTVFTLQNKYVMGNDSLHVYKNGVLMRENEDYIETDEYTVTFMVPMEPGQFVTFISDQIVAINSPIHEFYTHLNDHGQDYALEYRYNPGDNSLSVYWNGARLNVDIDYVELDDRTVRFLVDLVAGDKLVFRRETHMNTNVTYVQDGSQFQSSKWTYTEVVTDETKLVFDLQHSYVPFSNTLQVFVDGLLMDMGINLDYIEVDDQHIRFTRPLRVGERLRAVCNAGEFAWIERHLALDELTEFKTANPFVIGGEDLMVYENGVLLASGDDYIEVNPYTIRLNQPAPWGSIIKFYKRNAFKVVLTPNVIIMLPDTIQSGQSGTFDFSLTNTSIHRIRWYYILNSYLDGEFEITDNTVFDIENKTFKITVDIPKPMVLKAVVSDQEGLLYNFTSNTCLVTV